jgi:hypothetical protein
VQHEPINNANNVQATYDAIQQLDGVIEKEDQPNIIGRMFETGKWKPLRRIFIALLAHPAQRVAEAPSNFVLD